MGRLGGRQHEGDPQGQSGQGVAEIVDSVGEQRDAAGKCVDRVLEQRRGILG